MNNTWYKSSYSNAEGNCIETRLNAGAVQVRDSKDTTRPAFEVRPQAWRAFLGGVQQEA